ncbi:MAG: HD domain-containing protein [Planctomycetaceae bacterium]
MSRADQILELFAERGDSQYGHEAVTQREHALQCGFLAEQSGAPASLIVAALLHDIGHLLHELPDDAPDQGIDDKHENSGYAFLNRHFDPRVSEPVRLHVAAKRYLCTVDENYENQLSEPSRISLALQGEPCRSRNSKSSATNRTGKRPSACATGTIWPRSQTCPRQASNTFGSTSTKSLEPWVNAPGGGMKVA